MAQKTSDLWKELFKSNARREYQFDINGAIYGEDKQISHSVSSDLYDDFGIGNATSAKLTLNIIADNIPRAATIKRFVRLNGGDGERISEWLPAGVFFTNTRSEDDGLWKIEAFDILRKAETVWVPDQSLEFPMKMTDAVSVLSKMIGCEVDPRSSINEKYTIDYPANGYTVRNILQFIAAAHGGNFIVTPDGKLRLVSLSETADKHDIGLDLTDFKENGEKQNISRVTLAVDDSFVFTAGDDTGIELTAKCPYATQTIVNDILSSVKNVKYHMYEATAVNLDPSYELGDGVTVSGISSVISKVEDDGGGYPNISAPGESELEEEFPTAGPLTQAIERNIAETRSTIEKTASDIRLEVQKVSGDLLVFTNSVTGSLDDLQSQIDGAIETWFYNYVPTVSNAPASQWKTTEEKNRHLGDLFYIVDNEEHGGLVYRWALIDGVYDWQMVQDNDVAKALEIASKAQDTADGKRRVFIDEPKPPYDVGDLWTDGKEIKTCTTSRKSGSYTASDWSVLNDYANKESVSSLEVGIGEIKASVSDVEGNVTTLTQTVDGFSAQLNNTKDNLEAELSLKVGRDENNQIVSMLNASANQINIKGDRFVLDSEHFKVSANGRVTATGGTIAGWTITPYRMYAGDEAGGVAAIQIPSDETVHVFAAGGHSHEDYSDSPFRVTKTGALYARVGTIGGFSVTNGRIYGGDSETGVVAMQIPSDEITHVFAAGGHSHEDYSDSPFRVTKTGRLYARDAVLQGVLYLYDDTTGSLVNAFSADSSNIIVGKSIRSLGRIAIENDNPVFRATHTNGTYVQLSVNEAGTNRGIYDGKIGNYLVYADENDNIILRGNAQTATKLATSRTINGVSFDGSRDITVSDDTKLPLTGGTLSDNITVEKESSASRVIAKNNNGQVELMVDTNKGLYDRTKGDWMVYSNPNGDVTLKGNAQTASKVNNALTFTGSTSGSYDGSSAKSVSIPAAVAVKGNAEETYRTGNVNITPQNIGAVGNTGGDMTGNLNISKSNPEYHLINSSTGTDVGFYNNDNGNKGFYNKTDGAWLIRWDSNGKCYISGYEDEIWKAGDTLTISSGVFSGHVTSSSSDIYFSIPLGRRITASAASVTACTGNIRGVGGYVQASDVTSVNWMSVGTITATLNKTTDSILVRITKSSAFTGATNNTPIVTSLSMTIVLT